MNILDRLFANKNKKGIMDKRDKTIKVRLSNMLGDTNRLMTIQELEEDYKNYMIIDTKSREVVNIEKLENLDIEEVIVKKHEEECC